MPSSRQLDRLNDIVANCDRIANHVAGMTREAYLADAKTQDAVERCLQRVSEAAYKLGGALDARYPLAPWKQVRGIGNILRHQYDHIEPADIWASIEQDVPLLRGSALLEIGRLQEEKS